MGKRGNTRRMGKHATAVAEEQMRSTADRLQLEAETARCNYTKACEQVKLTASSLLKAEESRRLTTENIMKEVCLLQTSSTLRYTTSMHVGIT